MKGAFALLLLIALSAWSQPIYRNFFTTNPAPVVQVTAGTNATITFTLTGTDTRSYRVDIPYQTWLTNGFPWGVLYDPIGAALAATNGYPWTNIPASTIAASNVFSGGQIQQGTLFDVSTNEAGWLLSFSGGNRHRTWNGSGLTNIPIASIIGAPTTNGFVDATVTNGLLVANGGIATNLTIYGDAQRTNSWTYTSGGAIATNTGFAIGEARSINSTGNTWTVTGTGTGTATLGTNGTLYATRFSGSGSNLTDITASISTSGANNPLAFLAFNGTSWVSANPADTEYWRDDFNQGNNTGPYSDLWWNSGAGGGAAFSFQSSTLDHVGNRIAVQCNSASSAGTMLRGYFYHLSNSVEYVEWCGQTASLPSGTNVFYAVIGWSDAYKSYPANGAYFQYYTNSSNWQCVIAKGSSYTTNLTSTTLDTTTWWKLGIACDANTNTTFYINGSPVFTNSTASLTPTAVTYVTVQLMSSTAGGSTANQYLYTDYVASYRKYGNHR